MVGQGDMKKKHRLHTKTQSNKHALSANNLGVLELLYFIF